MHGDGCDDFTQLQKNLIRCHHHQCLSVSRQ